MRNVTVGKTLFEVREGPWGPGIAPWGDGLGVTQMTKGRVRLTLRKNKAGAWLSAGIIGPVLADGQSAVLVVRNRLDMLDPRVVFAVWTKHTITTAEVDALEATRWGDQNAPELYRLGYYPENWKTGDPQAGPAKFAARAFKMHRITMTRHGSTVTVVVEGQRTDGSWKWVANGTFPIGDNHVYKIALWCYETGPTYDDAVNRGLMEVVLESFEISDAVQ